MKTIKKLSTLFAALMISAPASAQDQTMELVETVGPFQISRVAASKVCFATFNGTSANGIPSFFATYKLANGDRWQVTGYSEKKESAQTSDILTIDFDGEKQMIIELELSQGSYFLPFTDATELRNFDAKVETAETVTFSLLRTNDSLSVNLSELRAAKTAIETCLQGLK